MSRKVTDIEDLMAQLLKELGLKFKREYYIGNYPVDFYLPDYKLSIQTDGCWHHSHKNCKLAAGKKYPRQVFQVRRDKACMAYHKHVKISILRIRECTLKGDRDKVINIIYDCLEKITKGKLISEFI